jgi:hypothetical protein
MIAKRKQAESSAKADADGGADAKPSEGGSNKDKK